MGELILCSGRLAAIPYFIDQASLNVYSLEELSYYIENNSYLLETDFMSEELCSWIDKELKLTDTAEQLREIRQRNGTLSEFVTCILAESGYCDKGQIKKIAAGLKEMENKSEFECCKIKADRYTENKRYSNAIYEYRRILRMKDEKNEVLVGNVWHNLGKAYAGLFLFREAAACFKRAYEKNQNPESLRECLYACRFMHDEKSFGKIAAENQLTEEEIGEMDRELLRRNRTEEICRFGEQIEKLFAKEQNQEIYGMLETWKDAYRKNCKV